MEIRLYPDKPIELYRQLSDQLIAIIATGFFKEGDQLPSVRELAVQLKVNPNTVQRAYQNLHDKGIILVEAKKRAVVLAHFKKDIYIEEINQRINDILFEAKAYRLSKDDFENIVKEVLEGWEDDQ